MNQPLHDFSEPILIRAIEENAKEFCNSITFVGQTTGLLAAFGCTNKKKARTEEHPS
jgi:hypothetical protein